ncbi:MAG: hypothetical protein ACRC0N_02220 [Acinetobacter johnsonii]
MTKKLKKLAIVIAILALVGTITRAIINHKGGFTVAFSMIVSGLADVWAWLPGNIGVLSALSGMILTWCMIWKSMRDDKRAQALNDAEISAKKEKSP